MDKNMAKSDLIGSNFNKVKHLLPNNGRRTEKRMFHKKIIVGYDKEGLNEYPISLECTIKSIDLSTETIFEGGTHKIISLDHTKETTAHKRVSKYHTLSICGSSKYMGGQILEHIQDLKGAKPELKEILSIWKDWHLNDMRPNCIHQNSFDCNSPDYDRLSALETQKCPVKYKYGSKWLIRELPNDVMNKIRFLFTNY